MSAAAGNRTAIRAVLREHRGLLAGTWLLFGLEMLTGLARPYLLGTAIDGLLAGHARGLAALLGVHVAYLIIGTGRHMLDTRAFSSVYRTFVTRLQSQPADSSALSKRSALSTLAREVTDFLQYDVNFVLEAVYNIVGSLIVMMVYDSTVVAICVGLLAPISLMARWYSRRAVVLNREQFDELEAQVDHLATQNPQTIAEHYRRLQASQVQLSDLEAINFAGTEICVIIALMSALLLSTEAGSLRLPVGQIVSLYTYVLRFATGLETIPYTLQRVGALRDILRRVDKAERESALG
jgi:ABC-type multidrug transport system fused ATPase/permease subunit